MNTKRNLTGATLAAAVALIFSTIPTITASASNSDLVICPGVNSCRGQSACQNTTNTCKVLNKCKGQNACKGQGHLLVSKAECVKLGGRGVVYGVPANAVNSQPYPGEQSAEAQDDQEY